MTATALLSRFNSASGAPAARHHYVPLIPPSATPKRWTPTELAAHLAVLREAGELVVRMGRWRARVYAHVGGDGQHGVSPFDLDFLARFSLGFSAHFPGPSLAPLPFSAAFSLATCLILTPPVIPMSTIPRIVLRTQTTSSTSPLSTHPFLANPPVLVLSFLSPGSPSSPPLLAPALHSVLGTHAPSSSSTPYSRPIPLHARPSARCPPPAGLSPALSPLRSAPASASSYLPVCLYHHVMPTAPLLALPTHPVLVPSPRRFLFHPSVIVRRRRPTLFFLFLSSRVLLQPFPLPRCPPPLSRSLHPPSSPPFARPLHPDLFCLHPPSFTVVLRSLRQIELPSNPIVPRTYRRPVAPFSIISKPNANAHPYRITTTATALLLRSNSASGFHSTWTLRALYRCLRSRASWHEIDCIGTTHLTMRASQFKGIHE
ncbi:hypothetical protein FB451DRAFT_1565823 [Mycena latifolia]|nr:hypothetical protein FB451DRAFT_1565823 [Mycena latifolia]